MCFVKTTAEMLALLSPQLWQVGHCNVIKHLCNNDLHKLKYLSTPKSFTLRLCISRIIKHFYSINKCVYPIWWLTRRKYACVTQSKSPTSAPYNLLGPLNLLVFWGWPSRKRHSGNSNKSRMLRYCSTIKRSYLKP